MPRKPAVKKVVNKAPKAAKTAKVPKVVKTRKAPKAKAAKAAAVKAAPVVAPVAPAPVEAAPVAVVAAPVRGSLVAKVMKVIDKKLGRRVKQVRIGAARQAVVDALTKLEELSNRKATKPNDRRFLKRYSIEELEAAIAARR